MNKKQLRTEFKAVLGLQAAGRASEAAGRFGRILDAVPPETPLLNEAGMIALRLGELGEGVSLLGRSLMLDPTQASIWAIRGVGMSRLQRPAEGLENLERAIELQPSNADAYFDRGCIRRELRDFPRALADFDQALALDAGNAAAHANRGALLHDMGRKQEAVESCRRAVEIDPLYLLGHCNLGVALEAAGRLEEALLSYERAIAIDPRRPPAARAFAARALVLSQLGRRQEARQSIERAFELDPSCAEAHFGLAVMHEEAGDTGEALRHCDRALAINPRLVGANWDRALLQLKLGNYEEGWRAYDWRWRASQVADAWLRDSPQMWLGDKALAGKTLLLIAEQGLGDTLQFCRYATLAAERGARVVLEVPKALQTIVRSVPGVAEVVASGGPQPAFDFLCPMLSLPMAFHTTLAEVPAAMPYLHADEQKVRDWHERLGSRRGLRVGLVWSGGFRPDQPELWAVNARRNIPLRLLAPLRHPAIEFHSLQKGEPAESEWAELRAASWDGPALVDWAAQLQDFSDTAALIENLDLVISVDTSTAHLAGALGRPVWILNRFDSCWRWLLDRDDSPWYPTARLYRQATPGDWEGVVRKVREDLLQRLV